MEVFLSKEDKMIRASYLFPASEKKEGLTFWKVVNSMKFNDE
jgi:hypothetical protein